MRKGKGRGFGFQIGALRDLHLDRVHALVRLAVMARRPPALEPAVEDRCEAFRLLAGALDRALYHWRAGCAGIRADVEIGQRAVEQVRRLGPDRVAVVEDSEAVLRFHSLQLFAQRRVIGRMVKGEPARPLGLVGRTAPDRAGIEIVQRNESRGVLAGVERGIVGRTVCIDHVAVELGAHDRRVGQQPLVEFRDAPVGIDQLAC